MFEALFDAARASLRASGKKKRVANPHRLDPISVALDYRPDYVEALTDRALAYRPASRSLSLFFKC